MGLLDLTALAKAVKTLDEVLFEQKQHPDNAIIKDAVIHRFEYNYELAFKLLKRYLEMTEASSEVLGTMSFQNIIRLGCERGLLRSELKHWQEFREKRNITSHTYNEKKAAEVVSAAADFLAEARFLLHKLQERTEDLK
ncbi:MAG: nucleotidyltransferase substrate binding protein [Candidatus Margulisbacteria bacterium]|jgi:nucleotidyltransferase substrate binding protein (TIGR01987 family)|nr:nucleotidyltransferase substrate binding protein [Candidatus Margulisiibacteriota bacterium]